MRLRSFVPFAVVVAAVGASASCSRDNPMAPAITESRAPLQPPATSSASRLLSSPVTIVPLQRTAPLATEQASATVGLFGGVITLRNSGLTLFVPPFAVRTPVTITATARPGTDVAYELAPHGLTFAVPVIAFQSLRGTEAGFGGSVDPMSLFVGYFPNSANITSVTELLDVSVNLQYQTAITFIWHFSGYVWSSGRTDNPPADSTGSTP